MTSKVKTNGFKTGPHSEHPNEWKQFIFQNFCCFLDYWSTWDSLLTITRIPAISVTGSPRRHGSCGEKSKAEEIKKIQVDTTKCTTLHKTISLEFDVWHKKVYDLVSVWLKASMRCYSTHTLFEISAGQIQHHHDFCHAFITHLSQGLSRC